MWRCTLKNLLADDWYTRTSKAEERWRTHTKENATEGADALTKAPPIHHIEKVHGWNCIELAMASSIF